MYEANKNDIVNLTLSELSTPKMMEVAGKDFVTNGNKNEYFRFLVDMGTASATNQACIEEISRLFYGLGLGKETGEVDEFGEMGMVSDDKDVEALNKIITAQDLRKIIKDRVMLGNAAFKVFYKGRGRRRQVKRIKHFPVQTLACQKIPEGKDEVQNYYYHHNWEKYQEGDKLKEVPAYNTSKKSMEVFILKPYVPNHFYWSPVQYSGGLDYANQEVRIAEYLNNDIENGFSGTTLININRTFDNYDKREQFVNDFRNSQTGTGGNKTVIQFNKSEAEKTTFERFPVTDAPSLYEGLAQEASRKILTSHRVPNPKLIGVPAYGESGGFGNNANEIEVAYEMFTGKTIKPLQDEFIEALEMLLENNKIQDLKFIPINPIDFSKHKMQEIGKEENKGMIDDKGNKKGGYFSKDNPFKTDTNG